LTGSAAVIVNQVVTTEFNITNTVFCQNDPLAATILSSPSMNGVTGTWSPSAVNTSAPGTSTYVFTPDQGQCATPFTISVVVNGKPVTGAIAHN
jgi:hypothetical protein